MLLNSFPAGAFAANCFVIGDESSRVAYIDPGQNSAPRLIAEAERRHYTPEAVLLTHGHIDHVFDAATVANHFGIPVYIHPADRHLLANPEAGVSADLAAALGAIELAQPDELRELADGQQLAVAGCELTVMHLPGHTAGLVAFLAGGVERGQLFCGDLLFRSSIGRTDLPSSDPAAMQRSLERVFSTLGDEVTVHPGHGDPTSIGFERSHNPFLQFLRH